MNLHELAEKLITTERARHQSLGWTAEHDATHPDALALAASSYHHHARRPDVDEPPYYWPWAREFWKPSTRIRDLQRSGSLYLAAEDADPDNTRKARARNGFDRVVHDLVWALTTQQLEDLLILAGRRPTE